MSALRYYALAYLTRTGNVVGEFPLALDPQWYQLVNDPGSWTIQVPVTGTGMPRDQFLEYTMQEGKFSCAICYGSGSANDVVCQAGPIWSTAPYNLTESPPVVQVGGQGMWGMLMSRIQFASTWDGVTWASGVAATADTTYTASTQGIAVGIIQNAINRDTLPIDLPAAIAGTAVANFYGYDMLSAGADLQTLTQSGASGQVGPDALFAPYLAVNGSQIRHTAVVGNPTISQPGTALYFDYPGSISQLLPSRTANTLAGTVYAKGAGSQYQTLWASATDSTLTNLGFPLMEFVDTSNTGAATQPAVTAQAQGDLAKYSRSIETWTPRVRMDMNPIFGSYPAGVFANYNLTGHPYRADGLYAQRILGFQVMQGDNVGEVRHLLQSTSGAL